jgi:anti-sigma factor RsiW
MSARADKSELTPREAADLSSLADGTLDAARRDEVQAWIDASPERTALYERERRVVELLHEARSVERAPERLRARVAAARAEQPRRGTAARRRLAWSGGLAGAVAAAALALVLTLPSGAPSFAQATAVGFRGPAAPAPAPDPRAPRSQLGRDVQDVYFPNWTSTGWQAVGQRMDSIGGRKLATVYYSWRGQQVAYTIVSMPALAEPAAPVNHVNGVELRTLTVNDRLVVTWRRGDHTCILSAQNVPAAVLRGLAASSPTA